MNLDQIAGVAHEPDGLAAGVVVLTHGASGSRESPLLKRLCDEDVLERRPLARASPRRWPSPARWPTGR